MEGKVSEWRAKVSEWRWRWRAKLMSGGGGGGQVSEWRAKG